MFMTNSRIIWWWLDHWPFCPLMFSSPGFSADFVVWDWKWSVHVCTPVAAAAFVSEGTTQYVWAWVFSMCCSSYKSVTVCVWMCAFLQSVMCPCAQVHMRYVTGSVCVCMCVLCSLNCRSGMQLLSAWSRLLWSLCILNSVRSLQPSEFSRQTFSALTWTLHTRFLHPHEHTRPI